MSAIGRGFATARRGRRPEYEEILEAELGRSAAETALDMGCDNGRVYDECEARDSPIPLRETPAVKRGAVKPAHQQAYIDWIERAHDGGLRLVCCSAVNNEVFADLFPEPGGERDRPGRLARQHRRECRFAAAPSR